MKPFRQLSLAIALDDQATFDNFYAPWYAAAYGYIFTERRR